MLVKLRPRPATAAAFVVRAAARPPRSATLAACCAWLAVCTVFAALTNPAPRVWLALVGLGAILAATWAGRSALAFALGARRGFGAAWLATPVVVALAFATLLVSDADSMTRSALAERVGLEGYGRPATEPVCHDRAAFDRLCQRADECRPEVAFLGDSLTARWSSDGRDAWRDAFGGLNAAEFGVGDERTQHVLWRVRQGQFGSAKPRLVVLLVGTNNLGHNTAVQTADGVAAVVEELRRKSPTSRVLLVGLLPRDASPTAPVRVKLADVNRRLAELADGDRVHFADVGGCLLDATGRLAPEVAPDGLHLSPAGYARLAAALRPAIDAVP